MVRSRAVVFLALSASLTVVSVLGSKCSTTLYQDTDCSQDPYQTFSRPSSEDCCDACEQDPECQSWTFHASPESDSGTCHFSLGAGVIFTNATGSTCGTNLLPPSPGPSPADRKFDCEIRHLALEYGMALLAGNHSGSISEALQLKSCAGKAETLAGYSNGAAVVGTSAEALEEFWVDPVHGDDAAAGVSRETAWRSLRRAADVLAETAPESRQVTAVNLLPGTHFLASTLRIGANQSGASAAKPVIWRAAPGSPANSVTVSGGLKLSSPKWIRHAAGVWSTPISPRPEGLVESLFVDGVRQFRARWPNGDPETYCPRDLHGGQCPGFAQPGETKIDGTAALGRNVSDRNNVKVYAKESGALIAEGVMRPFDEDFAFNVSTPTAAWHRRKATFSTFMAFEGGALERFDMSVTKAFWNTQTPMMMYYRPENFTQMTWARPELAVLHTYQSGYWGSWAFQLASVDERNASLHFSAGGFQEARGGSMGGLGQRGHAQDYYVENVFEELDAPREWYFDSDTATLYWATPSGKAPTGQEELVLPQMETLLELQGKSQGHPVRHVRFEGITFAHALPSFMRPHEPTSGGDWSIRRAAAVVVENAEAVVLDGCRVLAAEGNGVLLSRYVRDSLVTRSEFAGLGGTPLVLLGSAELMDGRAGDYPFRNELSHNYVHHWGVWDRQAAGYFEGLARRNNVSFNVFHDGPRAGANFNDGFGGGLSFEGNLLFNVVQDTGEHGTTNSWDRQPMLWLDDAGEVAAVPETRHISHNFVFRNSWRGSTSNKWALDKDDGSSNYLEESNVIVYGAIKDRDGLQRDAVGNLFLYPDRMPFTDTTNTHIAMAFQADGYQWDSFVNNTVVTKLGSIYDCGKPFTKEPYPLGTATMTGNRFITPGKASKPFSGSRCASDIVGFKEWQKAGYDKGSTQSDEELTPEAAVAMARQWLPIISGSSVAPVLLV